MIQKDTSGQNYDEVHIGDAAIRVTLIPNGWNNSPCLRIQIRDESGHLRQGPDVPLENCGDVIGLMVNLIVGKQS